MTPNQALWEKGDFTKLAALMRQSGEAVVESLAIRPPLRALDLGCGDGTTAVPLAQAGAQVLGIDIARNLVKAGQRRAAALGVADRLQFQHGDAGDLQGVADQSFDLVLSMFGAMFSPRPLDVALELVRVAKPGGRIVMGKGSRTTRHRLSRSCSRPAPPSRCRPRASSAPCCGAWSRTSSSASVRPGAR